MRGKYLAHAQSLTPYTFIGGWLFFAVELVYAVRAGACAARVVSPVADV
jgi:hypothetical protein